MNINDTSALASWTLSRSHFLSLAESAALLSELRAAGTDDSFRDAARVLDQVIVETLLWSGLQASEFCRLRVCDITQDDGRSVLNVVGKRDRQREVVIPTTVAHLIDLYVKQIRPRYLKPETSATDSSRPLFLNERGRGFERSTLYRRVTTILTRHGIAKDRASVQLLRHTYGYLAYRLSGSNLLFVQRQLGHAHPMVTAVYAKFVEEDDQATANRLAAALDRQAPQKASIH